MNDRIAHRRQVLRMLGGSALAAGAVGVPRLGLAADGWRPNRPVRIIVPYTPGGSSDIIARAISDPLSQALGQPVIVDNRPGANGNTGTDLVAKAPADGL